MTIIIPTGAGVAAMWESNTASVRRIYLFSPIPLHPTHTYTQVPTLRTALINSL